MNELVLYFNTTLVECSMCTNHGQRDLAVAQMHCETRGGLLAENLKEKWLNRANATYLR